MSRVIKSVTVDHYLSTLSPAQRKALKAVFALVRKTIPGAELTISYGIPAFRLGRVFMYCGAFRKHIGIYPPVTDEPVLTRELESYANAKGNLRFSLDAPLPLPLIARVARALVRQYRRQKP